MRDSSWPLLTAALVAVVPLSRVEQEPALIMGTEDLMQTPRFVIENHSSPETMGYPGIMPKTTEGWFTMPQH